MGPHGFSEEESVSLATPRHPPWLPVFPLAFSGEAWSLVRFRLRVCVLGDEKGSGGH